jgi:hypothetical protein
MAHVYLELEEGQVEGVVGELLRRLAPVLEILGPLSGGRCGNMNAKENKIINE